MKRVKYIFLLAIIGCAQVAPKTAKVESRNLSLGGIDFIKEDYVGSDDVNCDGAIIKHDREESLLIVHIPLSFQKNRLICEFLGAKHIVHKIEYTIEPDSFKSEKLRVEPGKVVLKGVDLKRALEEKKLLQNIYQNSEMKLLTNKGFSLPLNTKITSYFGTKRIYNGVKKSQHSGMDFRAYIGQSVYSTNSGKVVLNKNLFFTGNTVIIDHGMNIFSVYGHLKASSLKVGENINSRDIIGLAGNTGRSTGPHLHWGVKFSGSNVSGDSLIINSKRFYNKVTF